MTFMTWLSQQIDRDDPVGDLARDARDDDKAPRSVGAFERYIQRVGCLGAQKACAGAIREWRALNRLNAVNAQERL